MEYRIMELEFQGSHVRVVMRDGDPWWVAKDVCDVLEVDPTQTRRLADDEKDLHTIQTPEEFGLGHFSCLQELTQPFP